MNDEQQQAPAGKSLWEGDTGTLREASRRVLVALVKGPYLSQERHNELWRALAADEDEIRSRLADLFLELVVDHDSGVGFIRPAQLTEGKAPQVVRTKALTFLDTVLALHLRGELVRSGGTGRVILGKDEVFDHLQIYRNASSTDEAGFAKRINASWSKFEDLNLVVKTSTEGRFEISPILRLVFGAEEIAAVSQEYQRLLADGSGVSTSEVAEDSLWEDN